jgi:hypothetical protein
MGRVAGACVYVFQAVSVVCRVLGQTCPPGHWKCESSMECLPIGYLCDNINDCDDASDEDPTLCNVSVKFN